jgi:hypothetical protein
VLLYLEQDDKPFQYTEWAYFTVYVVATVGYGDLSAGTTPGRYAVMSIVAFAVFMVPQMTSELLELMNMRTIYSRMSYVPKGKSSQHIVICGDMRSMSIDEFFGELFHEDHENIDLNAVLLQPSPPSVEMSLMLRDHTMSLYLTYIQGSAMNDNDLGRAHVTTAVAIFIMANKFSVTPDQEDAKTILQQFSIQRYCAATLKTASPLFCLQLIRPENQRHLSANETEVSEYRMVIICLNEIKMGVLAKAIMFPGTNTLIMNLVCSFAEEEDDDDEMEKIEAERKRVMSVQAASKRGNTAFSLANMADDEDEKAEEKKAKEPAESNNNGKQMLGKVGKALSLANFGATKTKKDDWLSEYKAGCDWEIYSTPLNAIFVGMRFIDMAYLVFQRLAVVVIGLQVKDLKYKVSKVFLNPSKFTIPKTDEFEISAIVLAKNKADSDLFEMNPDDYEFFQQTLVSESEKLQQQQQQQQTGGNLNMLTRLGNKTGLLAKKSASQSSVASPAAAPADPAAGTDKKDGKKSSGKQLWKMLKRSNLLQKKIEMDSFQEKIQKLEEKHILTHYYSRETPTDLEECFIKTSVIGEIPHINNHLIVMGKDLSNLYDLIRPLRAKYLGSLKYIVILYPYDIPHAVWKRISYFDAILVVRGSSLEEADIIRAGIFRASQVVVLADSAAYEKSMNASASKSAAAAAAVEMESLIDSDAVFTFQCVRRLNPHTQVVMEIVQVENIAYMDTELELTKDQYKFTPQFASGSLFTTSLLDSLVCQAFYSPDIINVVNKLVSGVDHLDRSLLMATALTEDGVELPEDDDRFKSLKSSLNSVESSCLYLINIPDTLPKKNFGALFKHFAKENCVPIGLLRGIYSQIGMGSKSNKMPYVFTNPDRDCELFTCDRVFILSPLPIQAKQPTIKDWIMDIQMHKKIAEKRVGNKDNSISAQTSLLYGKIRNLSRRHIKLDAKLDTFGLQLNIKFELMAKVLEADPSKNRTPEELAILNNCDLSMSAVSSAVPKDGNRGADVLAEWNKEITSILEESATVLAADVQKEAEKVLEKTSTEDMRKIAESQQGLDFEIRSAGSSDDEDTKSVATGRTDGDFDDESEEEDEKQKENAKEVAENEKKAEMESLAAKMRDRFTITPSKNKNDDSSADNSPEKNAAGQGHLSAINRLRARASIDATKLSAGTAAATGSDEAAAGKDCPIDV